MPAFDVKATAHFEEDLAIAYRYYRSKAGEGRASKFLDEYDLTVARLKTMPTAAVRIGNTGLLWCPVGSFIAVFSVDAANRVVVLNRLFYMTSDWKRRILEES
jgi:hypothetical protein